MTDLTDEQIEHLLFVAAREIEGIPYTAPEVIVARARELLPLAEALLGRARKAEAENRHLIADRAANEKANIESRRSICEQSDRHKAERDALRDGNQAIVETCERIALERDEWKCEALGKRAALDVLSAERDALAAKLRAVEALARTPETDWLWEPGDRGPGFYYFRTIQPRELRAALSADTTPEATR